MEICAAGATGEATDAAHAATEAPMVHGYRDCSAGGNGVAGVNVRSAAAAMR